MKFVWLKYTPGYQYPRGNQQRPVGRHAYRTGGLKSLCGYTDAAKAGDVASPSDRPCKWCERVIDGIVPDRSGAPDQEP